MFEKINEREKRLNEALKTKYHNLKPKQKRTLVLIPRIAIFMFFVLLFSGILYTVDDYLALLIALSLLSGLLFFFPWHRIVDFFISKF